MRARVHSRGPTRMMALAAIAAAGAILIACGESEADPTPEATSAPTQVASSATESPTAQPTSTPTATATEEPAAAGLSEQQALVANTMILVDLVDSRGFHGIANDLAEATELSPRLAGQMTNLLAAVDKGSWPAPTQEAFDAFRESLVEFKDALVAEDLDASRHAAEVVHGTQHDLSKAVYAYLATVSGGSAGDPVVAMPSTMAAIDMIDGAGFHGIATDMAEATEINPRLAGTMDKILTVTNAAVWPAETNEAVAAFAASLEEFKAALEAEDLDTARHAAEVAHETQHDISKAVYAWLDSAPAGSHGSHVADFACVASSVDQIDSAGFHGIATDLAEATEINPRMAGTMGKILAHAERTPWPDGTSEAAAQFLEDLEAFRVALEANDLEHAREAAEAVHGSQHDLSKATYVWMGAPGH